MIKLLICDDSDEARRLVRTVLADHPEIEIVGEAADGETAVALAAELEPDVVLMDIGMAGLDGIEATRKIRAHRPETRVVAFTGLDDEETVQGMLEAGAASFVVKGAPLWELERALQGASQPLLRLAHTLARTLGERSAIGFLARETSELTGAALAAVYLSSEPELVPAGMAGPTVDPEPDAWPRETPGVVRRAYGEARPAAAGGRELIELYRTYGVPCGAATAVPLLADGERLGVLLIVMPANVQFDLDDDLVGALADIAAGDLSSRRKLALSQAEARRDPLTHLRNRRAFDEHLEALVEQATSRETPVALVLVDLDEFKEINDTKGHAVGDRVLVAVASVLDDAGAYRRGGLPHRRRRVRRRRARQRRRRGTCRRAVPAGCRVVRRAGGAARHLRRRRLVPRPRPGQGRAPRARRRGALRREARRPEPCRRLRARRRDRSPPHGHARPACRGATGPPAAERHPPARRRRPPEPPHAPADDVRDHRRRGRRRRAAPPRRCSAWRSGRRT